MKLFNGIRNLDVFWPSEVYLGGRNLPAGNFNAHSTPLTDSSAIPAIGPNSLMGSNTCSGAESRLWRAQLWGKARLSYQRGESTTWGSSEPARREWWNTDKWGRKCGCRAALPEGLPALGWRGMLRDAFLELCTSGIKRRSTMPEKFHHVSGISFQVTDYHCWFLGLQCSSANGSIKS